MIKSELLKHKGYLRFSPDIVDQVGIDSILEIIYNIGCIIISTGYDVYMDRWDIMICDERLPEIKQGYKIPDYVLVCDIREDCIPKEVWSIKIK